MWLCVKSASPSRADGQELLRPGSEVAVTFIGSLPFLAGSPRQPAPRGSSAWPHTCIAELFVEPILQVQLGGPGFYGFLGGEKENS